MNPNRIRAIQIFFLVLFVIALLRLFSIIFIAPSSKNGSTLPGNKTARGSILDREGKVLATSQIAYNIYLNTASPTANSNQFEIEKILTLPPNTIRNLYSKKQTFLLKRFISEEQANQIKMLREKSVLLERIYHRVYPKGKSLGHLLGFSSFEGKGIYGLEREYNKILTLNSLTNMVSIQISIDSHLQSFAEDVLEKNIAALDADGGTILIQNLKEGSYLVYAHSPSYNPEEYFKFNDNDFRDPGSSMIIEPGSIFKIFFLSDYLATHSNLSKTPFYNCRGEITIKGDKTPIRCSEPHGLITYADVIKHSCNTGIVTLWKDTPNKYTLNYLYQMGFGQKTGIDLPYEEKGLIPETKNWGVRTTAIIPMGHGISVTPIQLLTAFSALVNGGTLHTPHLVTSIHLEKQNKPLEISPIQAHTERRYFSKRQSQIALNLLFYGTASDSTGRRSASSGYRPVGKTGTTQQINLKKGGYYTNRYNAMFAAAFPPTNPQISVLILIKNPRKAYHGGSAAAPIYAEIIPEISRSIGIFTNEKTESLRNMIIQKNRSLSMSPTFQNSFPNLYGLSFRDAMNVVQKFRSEARKKQIHIKLHTEGSGYLYKQFPAPGEPISEKTEIKLYFKN